MFEEISELTGDNTVPQVFVDETFVGGYPEFKRLYKTRDLQKILPRPSDERFGMKLREREGER